MIGQTESAVLSVQELEPELAALQAEDIAGNLVILRKNTNENLNRGEDNFVPVLNEFIAGILTSSTDHLLQEEVTGNKISICEM